MMTAATDEILQRAGQGSRITPEEAGLLLRHAPDEPLHRAAHQARCLRTDPRRVTYLVDRNINYTNICVTGCLFCAFHRTVDHPEAHVITREELAAKLEPLVAAGGTRVLMQGGHHPQLRLPWYEDLLRWMRETFPTLEINAFSPSEIDHIGRLERMEPAPVLARLQAAGLAGLPGGGAEILVDPVRERISSRKIRTARWLEIMHAAQAAGLATSASMVIGWNESVEERVAHLEVLRRHQDEARERHGNGFTAFILWTAQVAHTPLGESPQGITMGVPAEEYLRMLAVARLHLDGFDHVQASWPTMGPAVAQQALACGADDFGSTMMEENVVSSAGAEAGRSLTVEEIVARIRAAGFVPAQRDTRYRILRVHERDGPEPGGQASP